MTLFNHILVFDHFRQSDLAAVRRGCTLLSEGGHLLAMDVLPEPWYTSLMMHYHEETQAHIRDLVQQRQTQLRERLEQTCTAEAELGVHVEIGQAFEFLIRTAMRDHYDVVVKAAQGRETWRMFFGSTAQQLFRKSPVPVWLVRPGEEAAPADVMVSIKPEYGTDRPGPLNRRLLENALRISERFGARLHVLMAWGIPDRGLLKAFSPGLELRRTEADLRKEAHKSLEALLSAYSAANTALEVHFVHGDPAQRIPEYARALNIDLLVMGSLAGSVDRGMYIGDVAESVFSAIRCGVLTFKPDNFVSPIAVDPERRVA
jgi:nucleotide-binding universal stress UspA family protein